MLGSSVDFLINARMLLGGVPAFCPIPPPPTAIKSGYSSMEGSLKIDEGNTRHYSQRQGRSINLLIPKNVLPQLDLFRLTKLDVTLGQN